jgi:hypothetical protein
MALTSKFPGVCKRCGCRFPAGTQIEWSRAGGSTHLTSADCDAAKALGASAPAFVRPVVNLQAVADFISAAKMRGLKRPKARFLAPDGQSEMRLSLSVVGREPGSVVVTISGEYVGVVRKNGEVFGRIAHDDAVLKTLAAIASDPVTAATRYGALTCKCSFCGATLKDDGSVEVGYGPVCAKNFGLPWRRQGVKVLTAVA